MEILKLGSQGDDVVRLQDALREAGFNPGASDGDFGQGTDAALRAFQRSEGLLADGVAGPKTLAVLLDHRDMPHPDDLGMFTAGKVARMFPFTPIENIAANLPGVLDGLRAFNLTTVPMALMALGTIRAEVESFEPLAEGKSKYNTSPRGTPFDLYDNRRDLGNRGKPDGENFRGRGYVQLTGRDNYERFGKVIGADLVGNPKLASSPEYAGKILAAFIKDKEIRVKEALAENDLRYARRLVNGGSHGLDRFTDAFQRGMTLFGGVA